MTTEKSDLKDQVVRLVQRRAAENAAALAGELVQATPDEKAAIRAGLDFERWLAETCAECLDPPQMLK
jgi:hypothetical protein